MRTWLFMLSTERIRTLVERTVTLENVEDQWTYRDESVLVPAHALNVVLLRDLVALVQASAAREAGRSHVLVVVVFVVFDVITGAAHSWLRSGTTAAVASGAASTTIARRPCKRRESACVVRFDSTTKSRCLTCSRIR